VRRGVLCLLAAAVLAAAAVRPALAAEGPAVAEAKAQIGKRHWLRSLEQLCAQPNVFRCSLDRRTASFVVTAVASDRFGAAWVKVHFADGAEGYMRYALGTARIAWAGQDPAAARTKQQEVRRANRAKFCTGGSLALGIDEEAAIRAWCFPDKAVRREREGHVYETWTYKSRGVLYFDNGLLKTIKSKP
jgi:hypothetical protein